MQNIQELMTTDCAVVSSQDTIQQAAQLMKKWDTGFIPVIDNGKVTGVITDRDLAIRGYAENAVSTTAVNELMTSEVISINPQAPAEEAARLMASHQIRRLPVVEQETLMGIVSIGDLATRFEYVDEAGEALSEISEQTVK